MTIITYKKYSTTKATSVGRGSESPFQGCDLSAELKRRQKKLEKLQGVS